MKKKGEFNFVWLFAIIAGGAILILAIYGAFKFGETKTYESDTEFAKSLAILTDPMQAGFAEGSYGKILSGQETRIRNICFEEGLGKNEISVSVESGVGQKWGDYGGATSVRNKYIFSSEISQGKEFYVFSKPFEFPYKVSDLIFLTEKKYCFTNAPKEISEEISLLKIPNIRIENCSGEEVIVCFGLGNNCDINVYGSCVENCNSVYDEGTVEKNGQVMKYIGSLIYGAIFSEKEIYECNVKRLLQRTGKIAEVLSEKADLMNARGCSTNLQADINVWGGLTQNATAEEIISLNQIAKNLNRRNVEQCSLW
jgi:hypothetical protein